MSKQTPPPVTPPLAEAVPTPTTPVADATVQALADLTQAMVAAIPTPDPKHAAKLAEYRRKHGLTRRFGQPVFLHGRPINARGMDDAAINAVNSLRSGTACDGLITIRRDDQGLHIEWPIKDQSKRFAVELFLGGKFCVGMKRIAAEQAQAPALTQ